jgi:hypothetical protein
MEWSRIFGIFGDFVEWMGETTIGVFGGMIFIGFLTLLLGDSGRLQPSSRGRVGR